MPAIGLQDTDRRHRHPGKAGPDVGWPDPPQVNLIAGTSAVSSPGDRMLRPTATAVLPEPMEDALVPETLAAMTLLPVVGRIDAFTGFPPPENEMRKTCPSDPALKSRLQVSKVLSLPPRTVSWRTGLRRRVCPGASQVRHVEKGSLLKYVQVILQRDDRRSHRVHKLGLCRSHRIGSSGAP